MQIESQFNPTKISDENSGQQYLDKNKINSKLNSKVVYFLTSLFLTNSYINLFRLILLFVIEQSIETSLFVNTSIFFSKPISHVLLFVRIFLIGETKFASFKFLYLFTSDIFFKFLSS